MKRALSPKDLAAAIGVSESSLKRWADSGKIAVVRTEGGHRRIDIAEAVRFVRESGVQLVRPDVLGLAEVAAVANEDGQGEALYQHLAAGNLPEVRGLLVGMYLRGQALATICDGPILAAMTRLGELWRHDSAGVFIEHRATDLIVQAVTQLRALIEPPREGHRAVGGAPAGDPYLLPSMLAATVLASEGVRAVNLGPDTPIGSLRHAVAHHQPRLVWVSVSSPPPPGLGAELGRFARELADTGATLLIGGRHRADVAAAARGATVVTTMAELAAFARGLSVGARS